MSNGCVLGITCNKPIRVSSPIPFKSQLRSRHGGFAIYMEDFPSAKTERISREETELLVHEQIDSLILIHALSIIACRHFHIYVAYTIIIFYIVILTFLIFDMFVSCWASLCV